MHGTYISYSGRAIFGTQRPLFSLYVLISTRQCLSFIGCIGSSHMKFVKLRSDRSADLKSLRWCGIRRFAGVGYMRIVHRVTQGKIFRFCA
jgi:hypothetical protein